MLDSFKSIVLYFYWPILMMSFQHCTHCKGEINQTRNSISWLNVQVRTLWRLFHYSFISFHIMSIVDFNFSLVESLIAPLNNKFQEELEQLHKYIALVMLKTKDIQIHVLIRKNIHKSNECFLRPINEKIVHCTQEMIYIFLCIGIRIKIITESFMVLYVFVKEG